RYAAAVDREMFDYVYHPTSKYWSAADGEEKLIRCFAGIARYNGFSLDGTLGTQRVEQVLENRDYRRVSKGQKRFYPGETTVKVYKKRNDDTAVSEIVWHMMENDKKLGIGYVVNKRFLWIWNYSSKRYLSISDLKELLRLERLLEEIKAIITQM
ncbi:MAG: hypothetical protein IIY34_05110, partial [Clostridia bacterium]|nr:hypothetical protein [Clostridia bacterium]